MELKKAGDELPDETSCPFGCCEGFSLVEHIIKEGLLKGSCSDISIRAFGREYRLHKLILSQSGYFHSLLTGPWSDNQGVHELHFDDSFITREAFDMAISVLYGTPSSSSVDSLNIIAIAQYLDIPQVVCSATDAVIQGMSLEDMPRVSTFALQNNYGRASERILDCARGVLCSSGWQAGVKAWDGIPWALVASVVGADCFFVPNEWERALFIIKLIERRRHRMEDEDEVDPVVEVLNTRVYYCHLTAEQLHKLEEMKDHDGECYVDPMVLRNALWQSVQLHKRVAQTDKKSPELGLALNADTPPDGQTSWFVPTKDETLYGTPEVLSTSIREHHRSSDAIPQGKTTEKHTQEGVAIVKPGEHYRVTRIPPFRFCIAFSGVSELEADKRVYAKTLWYAGSYWNLYIQKIRHRKGFQMGVYIHRASSCAPSRSGLLNRDVLDPLMLSDVLEIDDLTVNLSNIAVSESISPSSSTEVSRYNDTETEATDGSFLSYEDDRSKTSVYYIIYTPSRKVPSSLTCFISTPDLFNKSQSWGWKSNSMCAFNEDGTLAEGQDSLLKFMVVLGNT